MERGGLEVAVVVGDVGKHFSHGGKGGRRDG